MRIKIADALLGKLGKKLVLGVVTARVKVAHSNEELWKKLQDLGELQKERYQNTSPASIEPIKALIAAYKALKLKSEYKGSNELLLKRILADKGLYKVNSVVDANNFVSVASLRSIGSYDISNLSGDIEFREGIEPESYTGTTKKMLKLAKLPLLSDDVGPFGSPTSDSTRALISEDTTNLMTVIYSFDGDERLQNQLEELGCLLKQYSSAENIQYYIVKNDWVELTVQSDAVSVTTPESTGLNLFASKEKPVLSASSASNPKFIL